MPDVFVELISYVHSRVTHDEHFRVYMHFATVVSHLGLWVVPMEPMVKHSPRSLTTETKY